MKNLLKTIVIFVIGFAFLLPSQLLYAKSKNDPVMVNINTGDIKVISILPGIGKKTAEKIIQYRAEYGKFKKKEELINVKGIGLKKFEKIKSLIILSDEEGIQAKKE